MKKAALFLVILSLLILSSGFPPVYAETVNCISVSTKSTISTTINITSPGIYCLKQNLSATVGDNESAIRIDTSNVVLDLNGFELKASSSANQAYGIYSHGYNDIVIRNGTITGFYRPIFLETTGGVYVITKGHVVEHMRINSTAHGQFGIRVDSINGVIQNNLVIGPDSLSYRGLCVRGDGAIIRNNDVWNVMNSIVVEDGNGMIVDNNKVGSSILATTGVNAINADNNAMITNNKIVNMETGILMTPTAEYRDNIAFGCTVPYSGGVDIGNNN